MNGMIGRKVAMTQTFKDNGNSVAATVIQVGPCPVVGVKRKEKHGYDAVQLGFGETKPKNVTRPLRVIFEKAKVPPMRVLKEFHTEGKEQLKPGDWVKVEIFKVGEKVNIQGVSKGKGFAGSIKRWGFAGGPKTHGQSDRHRAPGSIGASSSPSRVWKGQRMAGRMGAENVTVKNLEVLEVDLERNLVVVKGAVPGPKNGIIFLRRST